MLHSQGLPKAGRGPRPEPLPIEGTLWAQHVAASTRLLEKVEGPGRQGLMPADSPPPE